MVIRRLGDGGELRLWERWLPADAAADYFARLRDELPWRQETIRIAGKSIRQPRLSAWLGDPGAIYVYSGLTNEPAPWTPATAELRAHLTAALDQPFNSALANYYRSEHDSMGWHADNEPELGDQPVIASLSFGATRRFVLRHNKRKHPHVELALTAGSLLVMAGTTQRFWKHAVPKSRAPTGPRINLTYRRIAAR